MKFYVATSLKNQEIARAVIAEAENRGHQVTFDWTKLEQPGETWTEEERRENAQSEIEGVVRADVVVFMTPGGRGAHCELGAALAHDITVIEVQLGDPPAFCLFYCHPGIEVRLLNPSVEDIVDVMEEWA